MIISSISELNTFAQSLIEKWQKNFLLEGELWVGKTQFVKGIVQALWWQADNVQSPTYTYMNIYDLPNNKKLLHMDLYRFKDRQDAFSKGIFEAIDNHDYICIERPRREEEYVDWARVRLAFSFGKEDSRQIEIIT